MCPCIGSCDERYATARIAVEKVEKVEKVKKNNKQNTYMPTLQVINEISVLNAYAVNERLRPFLSIYHSHNIYYVKLDIWLGQTFTL